MSHDATNWAIRQKGLKPGPKLVLWHLCDRFHPDNGCFPSLDTLAADCEMSRRSVQNHIDELEKAGLVRVEKMPRKHGHLPRNSYRFAFECDLGQNLPLAKSALGKSEHAPLANSGNHLGQNLPTNSVRVTSKREPVTNAGDFDAFWGEVPRKEGKGDARKAYAKALKKTDHQTLIAAIRDYAQRRADQDQQYTKTPAAWLNAERWTDEPAARPKSFGDKLEDMFNGLELRIEGDEHCPQPEQLPAPVQSSRPSDGTERTGADQADGGSYQQEVARLIAPKRFGGPSVGGFRRSS